MKHLVIALVSALTAAMLGIVTAAPAQADGRSCVSEAEYQNIRWTSPPATMGRVHDHFDTKGVLEERWFGSGGREDVVRSYVKCPEWNRGRGRVHVWFDNYSHDWRMRVYAMAPNASGNWVYPPA